MSPQVSIYWPVFVVALGLTTNLPLVDDSPMSNSNLSLGALYVNGMTGWQKALVIHVACCTIFAAVAVSIFVRFFEASGEDAERSEAPAENSSQERQSLLNLIIQIGIVAILFGIAKLVGLQSPAVYAAIAIPFVGRLALAWIR